MSFSNPITGGDGTLVRPAIKSPDYSPGVEGWSINRDGSAEFNDLTVRGVFQGTSFTINQTGLFFYDPTPGAGNLVGSWTDTDGNDEFGNVYLAGITTYQSTADYVRLWAGNVNMGLQEDPFDPFGPVEGVLGVLGDSSGLVIISATNTARPDSAFVRFVAGILSLGIGDVGYPHIDAEETSIWTDGALLKSFRPTSTGELEPLKWQVVGTAPAASYAANFAAASTAGNYQGLEYRLDGEDNLHIEGAFHCTAAVTTAQVFSLPAASSGVSPSYRPKTARQIDVVTDSSAGTILNVKASLQINSNGPVNLHLSAASVANQNFYVNAVVPLNNIP